MKYILVGQLSLFLCSTILISYNLLYSRALKKTRRDTGIAPSEFVEVFVKANIFVAIFAGFVTTVFILLSIVMP